MPVDLVDIRDIADMLGVIRQRADQITRRADFPEPAIRHARYRLWERSAVEAWLDEHRPGWRGDENPADGQ